ncbi:putative vacuole morphology and inheritance protein [Helianthus annuus]|nr:putative vacuole morphology and inheritance protein [Helianthus annuus]KAJ0553770.1 hypothetical protein HanHA89_Chr08g0300111 [Helianthus annuus]KAJ0719429.1 hypothetical protein HanLR1_Chr08g0281641 [Helianthus annuus]KAJ0722659.1 hypothetical protein HanOQP8_Chr08g0289151 [Helianthus annuus]KAJ0898151.1 putative vacuole morphology and inheritance protein [Helianthus annuus]
MARRTTIIAGIVLVVGMISVGSGLAAKLARVKVEGIVKNLTTTGDHDKITAVINLLTHEYTYSPQAN